MGLRWSRHLRTAQAGVLGVALLAAFTQGTARAQDDDDKNSIWNLDQRIFDGFAKGLGLKKGGDPSIDYRERSPLVLPPTRELPPPESAVPNRTAGWPVDPDAKRREDAISRKSLDRRRSYDEDYQMRAARPSELGPAGGAAGGEGKKAAAGGAAGGQDKKAGEGDPDGSNLTPSELGYFGGLFSGSAFGFGGNKDDVATFKQEPPRSTLTAPPVGYQTPSPEQPYGVSKSSGGRQTVTPLDPAVGRQ